MKRSDRVLGQELRTRPEGGEGRPWKRAVAPGTTLQRQEHGF